MKRVFNYLIKIFVQSVLAVRRALGLYTKLSITDLNRVTPISTKFGWDRGKPVDRYYIEKFLYENRHDVKGRILEVAQDLYSTRYARLNETATEDFSVETLHYDGTEGEVTIIGDLTRPETLPEKKYDCFICTQVYVVIYDVQKAIEGSYHVLKDGGVLLATVPGIMQIARGDMDRWGDYWRFTNKSIEMLVKKAGFSQVEIVTMGNVMSACAFLQGIALEEIPKRELLDVTDENYQVIIGIRAIK